MCLNLGICSIHNLQYDHYRQSTNHPYNYLLSLLHNYLHLCPLTLYINLVKNMAVLCLLDSAKDILFLNKNNLFKEPNSKTKLGDELFRTISIIGGFIIWIASQACAFTAVVVCPKTSNYNVKNRYFKLCRT